MAPLALRSVLASYYRLLTDRYFMGYALTGGLGMAGMFAYIVGSPFVFIELFQVRPDRFGFFFGANAIGLIAASQVNIRLTRRYKSDFVIGGVLTIQTAACLLLIASTIWSRPGLYPTAGLLFIYVALLGCLYPNTTALAMEPYREKAGSASALLGTLQFTLAATAAAVVGAANNGTAMPMAIVLGTSGIAAFLLYRLLVRRSALTT
jgi:DHA1 family bicyclomycin/chloramphenicol resistance-like MFS transporter